MRLRAIAIVAIASSWYAGTNSSYAGAGFLTAEASAKAVSRSSFQQTSIQPTARGRASRAGLFSVGGLPEGRYLVAAVEYLDEGEERDSQLLDRLTTQAARVTLWMANRKR